MTDAILTSIVTCHCLIEEMLIETLRSQRIRFARLRHDHVVNSSARSSRCVDSCTKADAMCACGSPGRWHTLGVATTAAQDVEVPQMGLDSMQYHNQVAGPLAGTHPAMILVRLSCGEMWRLPAVFRVACRGSCAHANQLLPSETETDGFQTTTIEC